MRRREETAVMKPSVAAGLAGEEEGAGEAMAARRRSVEGEVVCSGAPGAEASRGCGGTTRELALSRDTRERRTFAAALAFAGEAGLSSFASPSCFASAASSLSTSSPAPWRFASWKSATRARCQLGKRGGQPGRAHLRVRVRVCRGPSWRLPCERGPLASDLPRGPRRW